jgi:hypothetical protein
MPSAKLKRIEILVALALGTLAGGGLLSHHACQIMSFEVRFQGHIGQGQGKIVREVQSSDSNMDGTCDRRHVLCSGGSTWIGAWPRL